MGPKHLDHHLLPPRMHLGTKLDSGAQLGLELRHSFMRRRHLRHRLNPCTQTCSCCPHSKMDSAKPFAGGAHPQKDPGPSNRCSLGPQLQPSPSAHEEEPGQGHAHVSTSATLDWMMEYRKEPGRLTLLSGSEQRGNASLGSPQVSLRIADSRIWVGILRILEASWTPRRAVA